jgi:uncharacterized protein (TIGR03437 family)
MKTQRKLLGRILLISICICLAMAAMRPPQRVSAAAPVALVNAASYEQTVAPGSIAALFGSGMATQTAIASSLPLPTTLAGVTVKLNGLNAPLFFVSPNQINLQVPGGVAAGSANIEVFNTGSTTAVGTGAVNVAESSPGIFTIDLSGRNQAVALNSDFSRNGDFDKLPGARPEVTGNVVVIYATGVGNTNPLVADGQPAPGNPLAQATGATNVTIGGVAAQVQFSGLVPGFVGLWQINAVIPASLPTAANTPLTVELKGRQNSSTTLAIANRNEFGAVTGAVFNAITGAPFNNANITLQPTSNGKTRTATTDASGKFNLYVINPGSYNLSAAATGFITASQAATITGGQTNAATFALTAPLPAGQYRVIVTWQSQVDLDAHMTGPNSSGSNNSRFHVWWLETTDLLNPVTTQLDVDGASPGPETLTFTPNSTGTYRFSVHNYTNRDTNGHAGLSQSGVVVRIYSSNQQVQTLTAPGGGGTLWKVFEFSGGQLRVINQLGDEVDASNIKNSF